MSKYIIDTETWANLFEVQRVGVYGIGNDIVTDEKTVWSRMFSLDELEELNSDYINEHYGELQDEAYQKGINDGSLDVKQRVEGAYQRGLEDAWEAARKIIVDTAHGGIALCTLGEIFGAQSYTYIMCENTAQEAIDKIKAYEDGKHSDRIEVGDEVEWDGDKYVVTYLNYDIETSEITDYDLLAYDGSVADHVKKCTFTKTGKHYDIASILEAMRT